MKKVFTLPLGTKFVFDEENETLTLVSLCGASCGQNGAEGDYANSGLFVSCVDSHRFEGKKLKYNVVDCNGEKFEFRVFDEKKIIQVCSVWQFDKNNGIISCKYTLFNTSENSITLRRALPRWVFSPGKYGVYSQQNRWGNENQLQHHALTDAKLCWHGKGTRTTVTSSPWCVLEDEENASAVAFHVIPCGSWVIDIQPEIFSNESPSPCVTAGLGDADLFMTLAPGESIALPEVLIQNVPGAALGRAGAGIQQYMLKRLPEALHLPPVLYNSWLYRFTDFTREQLREQLASAKEMGCEVFIVDAGWFGKDANWSAAVGDWEEKPGVPFFGNMASFADEVRAAGLKFGFWMEIERFGAYCSARTEHPEWFPEHSVRIDLTQKAAAEYLFNTVAGNIRKFGAEYIKIDFNAALGFDESGAEFYHYSREFSGILERLRKTFPSLIIENCGSGSLRNDLATICLYDHWFVSDNAHPFETLSIRQGAFMRTLPGRCLNWIVTRPAPERRTPLTGDLQVMACTAASWDEAGLFSVNYVMLSGLLGVPGFSGDLAGLSAEIKAKMAEYIRFYKENREFFVNSHVYLLTPFIPLKEYENYCVFQMQGEGTDESLVFVFSNSMSRRALRQFKLCNLDAEKSYLVEQLFADKKESVTVSGETLMQYGMETVLPENQHVRHTAALYRVTAIGSK